MEEGDTTASVALAPVVPTLVAICMKQVKNNVTDLDLTGCNEDVISKIIDVLVEKKEVTGHNLRKLLTSSAGSLRHLDLRDSGHVGTNDLSCVAQLCPNLHSLNLERCRQITSETLRDICRACPGLRHLDLSRLDKAVDDVTLKAIGESCPNLESIRLVMCYSVTDAGVADLVSSCKQLHAIDFKGCHKITDVSLTNLATHSSCLQSISLKMVRQVSDKGLDQLFQSCHDLKNINLKQCSKLTDKAFINFACPSLYKLNCSYCPSITDKTIKKVVSMCPHLQTLDFQGITISSEEALIDIFEQTDRKFSLQKLNSFNIGEKVLSDAFITYVSKTKPQEDLSRFYFGTNMGNLVCKGITDDVFEIFTTGLPNLTKVVVGGLTITDEAFSHFSKLKKLEHLAVWTCRTLTAGGFKHISKCPNLQKLTVTESSHFDDECMSFIAAGCPKLSELRLLNCTKITDKSIEALSKNCPSMSKVLISGCSITDAGVAIIANDFKDIFEMDLSYCRLLRRTCLDHIIAGTAKRTLQKLSFEGMLFLTLADVQNIIDNMPHLTTLFCTGCDSVRGIPRIPRYDITVYLNHGTFYKGSDA